MAKTQYARINERGEIVLPAHLARDLGISPGDEIRIEPNGHGMYVHPPVNTLKRVYVELTNRCNLNCSTCMRNVWDVEYGHMSMDLFEQILASLDKAPEKPELFFGGYGEPLSHPKVLSMIERAKDRGYRVSLITNGILLTEPIAQRMIDLNLDMLWVSLDGASAECYTDVRLGDSLPLILENLTCLRGLKYQKFGISVWSGYPKLGIAFVAMERNIHDLCLLEVHENAFGQEQEGSLTIPAHCIQPGILEDGAAQEMIAILFAVNPLSTLFDDLWQIQVIPFDLSVIDALEACIETAADMNHNCI
jgi:antitoxin component of MazEF toxin-antitoxin module